MNLETVSVVKNLKTGKYFILLDEFNDRYRLINPEGQNVTLPLPLFHEDPETLDGERALNELSAEQLAAYQRLLGELAKKAAAEKHVTSIAKDRHDVTPVRVAAPPPPKPRSGGSKPRNVTSSSYERTGVGASWTATTLVFYRPQIDRLGPKQSFRVVVDGVGEFVISKQDFNAAFAEVILSPKFKAEGFFAYDKIPDKAMRFLQPK